jgi:hypothetical protein
VGSTPRLPKQGNLTIPGGYSTEYSSPTGWRVVRCVMAYRRARSSASDSDYITELREAGLIRVTQRGLNSSNQYEFLWHPWIADETASNDTQRDATSPVETGGSAPVWKNTTGPEQNRRLDRKYTSTPDRKNTTGQDRKNTTGPIEDEKIHIKDPSPQAYGSTGGPPPERLRGEPLGKGKAENRPIDEALLAQNSRKTNQDRPTPQPPAQSEQARILPPVLPDDCRAAALELKSRMRTPDLNAVEIRLLAGMHANGVPLEAVVNTVETGLTAAGKIISRLYYFEGPLRDLAAGKQVGNGNGNGGVDRKRSDFERRYDWGPNPPPIARLLPQHGFSPRPPGSEHYPGERPWAKVEELIATGGGAVTVEEWARLRKMGIVAS